MDSNKMRTTNHKSECPIRDQVQITTWPLLSNHTRVRFQFNIPLNMWNGWTVGSVTTELMSDNRFGVWRGHLFLRCEFAQYYFARNVRQYIWVLHLVLASSHKNSYWTVESPIHRHCKCVLLKYQIFIDMSTVRNVVNNYCNKSNRHQIVACICKVYPFYRSYLSPKCI